MTDRFVKERDYTDGATLKDEPVIAYGTTSFVDVVLAGGRGRMITLVSPPPLWHSIQGLGVILIGGHTHFDRLFRQI